MAKCAERQRHRAVVAALWTLVGGLICLYLVIFALEAAGRLVRPLEEITYGESWLLDGARQVARGEGLYAPADRLPLMQIAYTPLYYATVGGVLRVFGDSGYTAGRAVSLVATLVGAAAMVFCLARITGRWWAGALAAGLFLTQNLTVMLWAPLSRVDALALGLTLVGLALFCANRASLAAIVFVLAFFTKQTYVVAPLAAGVALWPCRRRLVRLAGLFVGMCALGVGVAEWLTHGWFLWHIVAANSNQPDLWTFSALMGSFMQYNGLPVLAALAAFALPPAPGERVWRLYLVGSLLSLATLAKLGASSNYWLEATAASSALLALAACHLGTWPAARTVAPTVIAGALLIGVPGYQAAAVEVAATAADVLWPQDPRYLSLVGDDSVAPYRVQASFVERVSREPGELLTDNSGLAVAAGKRIQFEFQIFQLLQAEGHWSDRPILDAITARRFSLVALMHPLDGPVSGTRWSPAIQAALQSAYVPDGVDSGFWLYRPR